MVKTIKIDDETHRLLTKAKGKYTMQKGKLLTYAETIKVLLEEHVTERREEQKRQGDLARPRPAAAPPNILPKELADLVVIEDAVDAWKVRPRTYLGSERFSQINEVVKKAGGHYQSGGKTSHWLLPKAKQT